MYATLFGFPLFRAGWQLPTMLPAAYCSRRLRLPIQTKGSRRWHQARTALGDAPFRSHTCIAFPQLQDRKVAQGVSARASSIATAYSKMFSSSKPAAFTLGLLRTANSHHVQATQNDSRNLMNITTGLHIVNRRKAHLTANVGRTLLSALPKAEKKHGFERFWPKT
jgi:hypothetical protein